MNNKLYCTFLQGETVEEVVGTILEEHDILFNKIFVLISPEEDKTMLTYNIDGPVYNLQIPNTILVHRKKQSNTLYTINALNELVKEENNGVLDKKFSIDWDKFKNSIIVTNVEGTKKISTRIFDVIEFNKK